MDQETIHNNINNGQLKYGVSDHFASLFLEMSKRAENFNKYKRSFIENKEDSLSYSSRNKLYSQFLSDDISDTWIECMLKGLVKELEVVDDSTFIVRLK